MKLACARPTENHVSRTSGMGDSGFFLLTSKPSPPPRRQDAKKFFPVNNLLKPSYFELRISDCELALIFGGIL